MKYAMVISFFMLCSIFVKGQSLFESATQNSTNNDNLGLNLTGYVRGSAFCGGETYDFTNVFGEVSLQAGLMQNQFVMNSDIRFRSGFQFNQTLSEFELKEAYAGIITSHFDLLLGEQIVSWGRTDGFNPTNNITPNNYFFFSANPDDQKIPNFMLRADIRLSPQIDWEIIALPIYRPSVYHYELFDMGENVSFSEAVLPNKTIENASLASKVNFELPGIGFSVSWFNGYDPFYGFNLQNVDFSTGSPAITYTSSFYKKNTIGLDFSVPVGTWIFRGEGAYNSTDNSDQEIYIPNSDLSYVAAMERDFGGFHAIVQYVGKATLDFNPLIEPVLADPLSMMAQLQYANDLIWFQSATFNRKIFHQQEAINNAFAVTVSKDFAYETINGELTAYYNLTSEEYLFRPKLMWKIGGALTASVGYTLMKGPDKSLFNYAAPIMNGAFVELKASF